jgi:phosphoglycolate phosphatase
MDYKAVLFDLDGTLLDTLQDLTCVVNTSLGCLGFPTHTLEVFKYFVGDGREEMIRRSLPEDRRDPATMQKTVELVNREYNQHCADHTRPYPGIPELLDTLTQRGYTIAILSNKPDDFTKAMVSQLLPSWHFAAVAGASPALPIKPHPAGALKIARDLGLLPSDFLYLGDSDIDMKTALAAGMYPVGVTWGFRTAGEIQAAGAKVLINHPLELLPLL